MLIMMY